MRHLISFFALLFVIALIPVKAVASSDKLFTEATKSERKVSVPHPVLKKAMIAHEAGELLDADLQELLQLMFLEYSPAYMQANILFLETEGGHKNLLNELDTARAKVVSIRWESVSQIYDYAQTVKNKHLKSAWHSAWQKYPAWRGAVQYRMDIVLHNVDQATIEFEYEQIFREAQIGLRSAMIFLADHYERGKNLEKSAFKSAFWLFSAQWEGADISKSLKRLSHLLSNEDIKTIEKMINENKYPDVMTMPENGWEMYGGPNKRWTPPYKIEKR